MAEPKERNEKGILNTASKEASSDAKETIHCLFVRDKGTGVQYLVDTSTTLSILPRKNKTFLSTDYKLYVANGTPIPTYGEIYKRVYLGTNDPYP